MFFHWILSIPQMCRQEIFFKKTLPSRGIELKSFHSMHFPWKLQPNLRSWIPVSFGNFPFLVKKLYFSLVKFIFLRKDIQGKVTSLKFALFSEFRHIFNSNTFYRLKFIVILDVSFWLILYCSKGRFLPCEAYISHKQSQGKVTKGMSGNFF